MKRAWRSMLTDPDRRYWRQRANRRVRKARRGRAMVDLRNVYNRGEAEAEGFDYFGLGRGRQDGRNNKPRISSAA